MKFLKFAGLCLCGSIVICSFLLSIQFFVTWNLVYLFISSFIFFFSLGTTSVVLEKVMKEFDKKRK